MADNGNGNGNGAKALSRLAAWFAPALTKYRVAIFFIVLYAAVSSPVMFDRLVSLATGVPVERRQGGLTAGEARELFLGLRDEERRIENERRDRESLLKRVTDLEVAAGSNRQRIEEMQADVDRLKARLR